MIAPRSGDMPTNRHTFVNVVLDRSMTKAGNTATENKAGYVAKIMSADGLVTASTSAKGGIFVTATKDLHKGTKVMECSAASLALDPAYRRTHCGFCTRKHPNLQVCKECQVIGCCPNCSLLDDGRQHKNECAALQALGTLFPNSEEASCDPNIDSSHLLTVRLLCRRADLDWELSKCLYAAPLPDSIDADVVAICNQLQVPALSWVGNDIYKQALARVIGCSHAITDVSLSLGSQSLGRGLFPEHSFYNHSCAPNAFLSCFLMTNGDDDSEDEKKHGNDVVARLHLLSDVKAGDEISISYIPTSGLSNQERQQRLQQGYDFACGCEACSSQKIVLPPDADVESIREIQFSCDERLLKQAEDSIKDLDEIEHIISLVEMTKRGIRNQEIPHSHEVSIETDRLLAMAYSLSGKKKEANKCHESFFSEAAKLEHLFDPVAMATERIKCANVLEGDVGNGQLQEAIAGLEISLGEDHPWVRDLSRKEQAASLQPASKKRKSTSN
jgi:hypothetical protein